MTDFLLAGRRLGPVLLGAALMATHFGGGAVMCGGEYGFKYDLSGAAQVFAAKGVLSILGITGNTGAIIAAIVFILYTVAGGLWATTMTDFTQIVIAGIGVVVASIIVLVNTGGGTGLLNIIAEKGFTSGYFNLGGMGLESSDKRRGDRFRDHWFNHRLSRDINKDRHPGSARHNIFGLAFINCFCAGFSSDRLQTNRQYS